MDGYREVLQIIADTSQPLGWYGIEIRLGRKGIVLEENLIAVLRDLVDQGVLVHEDAPGHPHGVYHLTDLGKVHLERQQPAQPA